MSNPLVAQAQSQTTAVTGIGILESAQDLSNGIKDGSWVEGGLGALGAGLEILSMVIDPLGTLAQYGVAWLIEHVRPLKEALDWLAGDPPVIQSFADTWANVAKEVGAIAGDLKNEVDGGTAGWSGQGADTYRDSGAAQAEAIAGAASLADGISTGVMIMGMVVGFVREMVRDIVAELVGKLITWALEAACTLGFATPLIAAQATAAISSAVTRISDFIRKLVKTIGNVSPRISRIIGKLDEIIQQLAKIGRRFGGGDGSAPSAPSAGTRNIDAPNLDGPRSPGTSPASTAARNTDTPSAPDGPGSSPDGTSPTTSSTPNAPDAPRSPSGPRVADDAPDAPGSPSRAADGAPDVPSAPRSPSRAADDAPDAPARSPETGSTPRTPAHSPDAPAHSPGTPASRPSADSPSSAPHSSGDPGHTSASSVAPPATPRAPAEPGPVPSPRHTDAPSSPQTPVAGPVAPGSPNTPGAPASPSARPGGWTGTPGTRAPDAPAHRTPEVAARGETPARPARADDPPDPHRGDPDGHQDPDTGHQDQDPLTPDEVNQRHAEPTPAGTSYHAGDPEMGDLPQRVRPDPDGRHTVDVHVTPDGRARIGGREYTPEEFADILRRNPGYDGGPIRLIGCDSSANGFAHRLSRELDTDVMAPSKPAWSDSQGRVYSSDYEIGPDGRPRPKIPPTGEWEIHRPDGTTSRAGADGFAPGTRDADKQDLDPADARDRGDEPDSADTGRPGPLDHEPTDPDDPEFDDFDPVPQPRVVSPDEPEFGRPFAGWDRPTHFDDGTPRFDRDPGTHGPDDPGSPRTLDDTPVRSRNSRLGEDGVPQSLRGERPLAGDTEYRVRYENGAETRFFTDSQGNVRWVESTPAAVSPGSDVPLHNPDLRHPLLPDTQYRVQNFHDPDKHWTFNTDSSGRTETMTGDPSFRGQNEDFRDQASQNRATREGKAAFRGDDEFGQVRWAGGHLAANEMGGPGEYVNMHPQMAASNSGNYRDGWVHEASWRRQEVELRDFAAQPGQDVQNYQVRVGRDGNAVPDNVIMRWEEVVYRLDGNGDIARDAAGNPIEMSRVTKEREFPNNPAEVNYGPRTPYGSDD